MRHREPDRVPVMCQLSLGHYFLNTAIPPVDIWHSTEEFGEALIALQQRYGFDGILVNLPGREPKWRDYISRTDEGRKGWVIHWVNGWHTVFPSDDNPHVFREDGTRFQATIGQIEPGRLFYVEPHDLGGIRYPFAWGLDPEPASPVSCFPPWHFDTLDLVRSRVGSEISIHAEVFSPFSQFLELLGYSAGLMALLLTPDRSKACLEALVHGTVALGLGQAEHGADAILISSAFAGAGFISPAHYREFVLPCERMVIEGIKARFDIPIYTHTCGSIGDRLELIAETGTDGIDTLDPPPLGDVDLADAKKRIGSRLFIKGNLDPVNVLWRGTPDLVYRQALTCLSSAAAGGGYILSSACSVPPYAPPENLLSLRRAVEAFSH